MCMKPIPLPFISPVNGVSFRQEVLHGIIEGDKLTVVPVDDNPHDAMAVEVRTADGEMAGFIPKQLAARLRASGSGPWHGDVKEVLRNDRSWGLRISVSEKDPAAVAVLVPAPDVADASDEAVSDEAPKQSREVRAGSGRLLGTLLSMEDGVVVVMSTSGVQAQYPRSVVMIQTAS
jgi:hypothetical protein